MSYTGGRNGGLNNNNRAYDEFSNNQSHSSAQDKLSNKNAQNRSIDNRSAGGNDIATQERELRKENSKRKFKKDSVVYGIPVKN